MAARSTSPGADKDLTTTNDAGSPSSELLRSTKSDTRDSRRGDAIPSASSTNEMKVEVNLSWFVKRDKPLISIGPRKSSSSSSSSSDSDSSSEDTFIHPLEKWFEATHRREITMAVVGRSGAGKSTLIHNLLRLTDRDDVLPQCRHSPSSVTTKVELYTSFRAAEEITIRVFDTPGLTASDVDDTRIMAELHKKTGGRCDVLLYCVSLLPDSKIGDEDEEIIKKLALVFGKKMWEHATLVLTFANVVKTLYVDYSIKDIVEAYCKQFQLVLEKACLSYFPLVSVFSCDEDQGHTRSPSTVIAVPTGNNPDEQLSDDLPVAWDVTLLDEVVKKCKVNAVPVIFIADSPWASSRRVRLPLEVCGFALGTAFAVSNPVFQGYGLLGCFAGAMIGATVRLVIGSRSAVRDGARLGYFTTMLLGGVTVGYKIFVELQEHEAKQRELENVQNEIKRHR